MELGVEGLGVCNLMTFPFGRTTKPTDRTFKTKQQAIAKQKGVLFPSLEVGKFVLFLRFGVTPLWIPIATATWLWRVSKWIFLHVGSPKR